MLVVLVGGGAIAPLHAQYLRSSASCQLVAIVDPFPPGKELALQLSLPYFQSVPALLSGLREKPAAYVICVPSKLHVAVATEIINCAGPKALLIEKPFSVDSQSGAELLDLAALKSCKILVGHHRRFHPSLSIAKAAIERGRIGQITAISSLWATKKSDDYFRGARWRALKSEGGGPIWTNFVHDIDAVHFIVGAQIVRVWAIETVPRRKHDGVPEENAVDEGAAIMAQFSNGAIASFIVSDNTASLVSVDNTANADCGLSARAVFCSRAEYKSSHLLYGPLVSIVLAWISC